MWVAYTKVKSHPYISGRLIFISIITGILKINRGLAEVYNVNMALQSQLLSEIF